jgi:hypothetical protein
MKMFVFLFILTTTQAFAFNLCKFASTADFQEKVEAKKIKEIKRVSNEKKFNAFERDMIFAAIRTDSMYENVSKAKALKIFSDYQSKHSGPGSDDGEILYYEVKGQKFQLVHYWPGDNEYGAFVELKPNGKISILASVNDGEIRCQ